MKTRKLYFCVFLFWVIRAFPANNYATTCYYKFFQDNQFGAQVGAVCWVLGFAWEHNLTPLFYRALFLNAKGGKENYSLLFSRLVRDIPKNLDATTPIHIDQTQLGTITDVDLIGKNICLCCPSGPNWYFTKYHERFRELLFTSPRIMKKLHDKYTHVLATPNTVAVHVRTYHPKRSNIPQMFLGRDYYVNAMSLFPDDHLFVVFSDRIGWCKENLANIKPNMIFIDGNHYIEDFYLMSYCKHFIIANSSLSLNAAFLRKDLNGQVIAPGRWDTPDTDRNVHLPFDSTWTILPVDVQPPDLTLLQYETTSIDEKNK